MVAIHYVFPVFGGDLDVNSFFYPKEIYGTAFSIGNGYFITCAHTITNALQHNKISLGYAEEVGGNMKQVSIGDYEKFEDLDCCIFRSKVPCAKEAPWYRKRLVMLEDVFSIGYPYGFDINHKAVMARSFKGHIIMDGFYRKFPGHPTMYELSYQIPKGLSGGPLFHSINGQDVITGFTIGNEITDMIVNSFREKDSSGQITTIYEKTEALHRGIAIDANALFKIKSELLGSTLMEYLEKNKLVLG